MHLDFDTIPKGPVRLVRMAGQALALLILVPSIAASLPARLCSDPPGSAHADSGPGSDGSGGGNSGPGKGGDDGDGDDSGTGKDKGDDSGGDKDDKDDNAGARRDGDSRSRATGVRDIDITAHGIAVTYNDGAQAEIRDGRYSYREPSGRIALQRPATGADIALMRSITRGRPVTAPPPRSGEKVGIIRAERGRSFARITYSNGWVEAIENGQYSLQDSFGRRVALRPATAADRSRLLKDPSR